MGYVLAWRRRWALLSALVPVLVPASLILLALRLLAAPGNTTVINGELVTPVPGGSLGFVHALVAVVAWLLAVASGIATLGGVRLRVKELAALGFWVLVAVGATNVLSMMAVGLGWYGIALLLPYAYVLARFSLVLPSRVFDDDSGWDLARGRSLRAATRILIGVVAVRCCWPGASRGPAGRSSSGSRPA